MNNDEKKGEIDGLIKAANELRIKGEHDRGLHLLDEAEKIAKKFPNKVKKEAMGDIAHHKARVLQAMGKRQGFINSIARAIRLRKDPIQHAYSVFQRYIGKKYLEIKILPREVKETQEALSLALVNIKATVRQRGDMLQNIAYVESQEHGFESAFPFYKATLIFRKGAYDERGIAMTNARLAECHLAAGRKEEGIECGERADFHFRKVNDQERINQIEKVLEKLHKL